MLKSWRSLLLTGALLAMFVGAGTAWPATPQAPLSGEVLSGPTEASISCSAFNGGTGTYTSSGTASGPYPGTYTESVSFTIVGEVLTAFDATFTITSGSTTISGSKTLTAPAPGSCTANSSDHTSGEPFGRAGFLAPATYQAIITTPTGRFSDTGTATTEFALDYNVSSPGFQVQTFTSSGTEAVPVLPSTKDECKHGGWQVFGFKNQGQCVSSVTGPSR